MSVCLVTDLGRRAKAASRVLAGSLTEHKDAALANASEELHEATDTILEANAADVAAARELGLSGSLLRRLELSRPKVESMAAGLRVVALLPDPIGEVTEGWRRPNGLEIRRVRVPLGVIGIIYESRPNVTADAAGLCLKSGNACILRGGKEAVRSNTAIAAALRRGLERAGLPVEAVQLVADTTRETSLALMQCSDLDCLIPRGGEGLLAAIREHATVPYIVDGAGVCHTYVDAAADLAMAVGIAVNAKTSYPAVCNAMETLLVHQAVAAAFLPAAADALVAAGVELRGCERTRALVPDAVAADASDWDAEYLDLVLAVRVVDSLDAAIEHIAAHGTLHSEAIVTGDRAAARRFCAEVDAAAVYVNASTRFTDGERFGFGAEIGISTQKLHARGPLGLRELTCCKYIVEGDGQVV